MPFLAFRNNGDLVVVDAARGRYRVIGAGSGCFLVAVGGRALGEY